MATEINTENDKALESQSGDLACSRRTLLPRADVLETPNSINVLVDLPGVGDDSLDITVEKNILSIAGKASFDTPAALSLAYGEFEAVNYQRRFVLSNEVDRNAISATMKNGVLNVLLPKSAGSQVQKIRVTAQ